MTHFCAAVFSKNLKKMLYKVETEKTKELCCLTIQSFAMESLKGLSCVRKQDMELVFLKCPYSFTRVYES